MTNSLNSLSVTFHQSRLLLISIPIIHMMVVIVMVVAKGSRGWKWWLVRTKPNKGLLQNCSHCALGTYLHSSIVVSLLSATGFRNLTTFYSASLHTTGSLCLSPLVIPSSVKQPARQPVNQHHKLGGMLFCQFPRERRQREFIILPQLK